MHCNTENDSHKYLMKRHLTKQVNLDEKLYFIKKPHKATFNESRKHAYTDNKHIKFSQKKHYYIITV